MDARHVYVHVPFCARRCSYCDFAIAVRRTIPVDAYLRAVETEIRLRQPVPGAIDTLYLGGGTPSRLGTHGIERLLTILAASFPWSSGAEVTLEANPEDVTADSVRGWRDAGITRVSLGVQSFNDDVLRWMHRTHDAAQAERAGDLLQAGGIEDWSLDLIFALPEEVSRSWEDDLARAIAMGPAHISCYGLTVEPFTPLGRWTERGDVHQADDDRYVREFLAADAALVAAGFEHYEVSNYSRSGGRSRHNSAYWSRVAYLGLGPSAHSFDGDTRRWNTRDYAAWADQLAQGRDPLEGSETLDSAAIEVEEAYLALRTTGGVQVTASLSDDFRRWSDHGWATVVDGVGRLTPLGWLRLDSLVPSLTVLRSR